jgi:hypothetical protein
MNIRQYLNNQNFPQELNHFANFSPQLKKEYRTLDGYAFDFDCDNINSVKLYYKIYTKNFKVESEFLNWFLKESNLENYVLNNSNSLGKGLTGINFSIKYKIKSNKIIKSVYIKRNNTSSTVFHFNEKNIWSSTYFYIYNTFLIKCINKIFNLNMPIHNEAIELSIRDKIIHASIFPRVDRSDPNLTKAKNYCLKLMPKLLLKNPLHAENTALSIHSNTKNSSFITKGYTSNELQKIYFGCFDWENSVFSN